MTGRRRGFTLIEVLIVVVIMAVLAALIIPQFTESTQEAKTSAASYNLNQLRNQIATFKAQHGGSLPNAALTDLTGATTYRGRTFGPYIISIPENSLTGNSTVKRAAGSRIVAGDITAGNGGGWVYCPATGEIRLDHVDYWQN